MLSAGWSNERTFQLFYHKSSKPEFNYGHEILRTFAQLITSSGRKPALPL